MIWWLGLACATPPQDCASLPPGPQADLCWRAELLATGPQGVDAALALAPRFSDPLAQEEAVMAWMRSNGPKADPQQGERLCALLSAQERQACVRRLHSAHLRR